jgi:outer membrane protein assembly factor BamB
MFPRESLTAKTGEMMHLPASTNRSLVASCLVALVATCSPFSADGGDWPQILGPSRNGQAKNERLLETWPESGPRKLWSYKLGSGFGGPAAVGQRVIVFHRVGGSERVEAIDIRTGKRIWATEFSASYRGGVNSDIGPRCVPIIHDEKIVLYGAAGDLHCVSLSDGKKLWSRQLYDDYGGDEGYFGAGTTPLVFEGKVLVNVGGRKDAGLAAFSLATGKTIWTATSELASYSSPTLAKVDGKTHAIFVTRMNTVSVDPEDGQVYFRFPFGKRGPTVNAATPLVFDNRLFVTASYGVGCRLVQLGKEEPKEVWASETVMSSQYTTCVYHDGHLYGADGREDFSNGKLRCIDAQTGKLKWSVDDFGVAHSILVNGKILLLGIEGKLVLAEATPKSFRKLASATLASDTTRSLPALADGKLLLRTNGRGTGKLICVEVGHANSK